MLIRQSNSPSLKQSFHRSEWADQQRKAGTLLPSRRRVHPMPTSLLLCYTPGGCSGGHDKDGVTEEERKNIKLI